MFISASLKHLKQTCPIYIIPVLFSKSFHTTLQSGRSEKAVCTLIPGDGVGPELSQSVLDVFRATNIPVKFERHFLSEVNPLISVPLQQVVHSVKKNRVCLKGVVTTPDYSLTGELESLNMKLRHALDMYANVVQVKSLSGIKTRHTDVDFVIIREQTEGEYSGLEHESVKGVVESLKIVTCQNSTRIAKFAFDYAMRHHRKKVTAVHKANIMKLGDGLFLSCCEQVSKLYPNIKFDNIIIDNAAMQMVSKPSQFDVLVMPNLYGNILDNVGAGLIGGAGILPGASYSSDSVIFEPAAKHTYAKVVGKNIANPTAMLLCAVNMLVHMNLVTYADRLKAAIYKVIRNGKFLTRDVGGHATTLQFTNAVIKNF